MSYCSHKTRPSALVQDKYAMALKYSDVTVGHVPKYLSKITYIYRKHGGDLLVKIIGERRFSQDFNQGRMELRATYIYRSTDMDVHSKLLILAGEIMEEYNKANSTTNSKLNTKQKKKKETARK